MGKLRDSACRDANGASAEKETVRSGGKVEWMTMKNTAGLSAERTGRWVHERRLSNRLTQRQFAELSGVGLRLVSELERGKSTLRMDAVNRVLAVFGLMLGPVEAPRNGEGALWDESEESN